MLKKKLLCLTISMRLTALGKLSMTLIRGKNYCFYFFNELSRNLLTNPRPSWTRIKVCGLFKITTREKVIRGRSSFPLELTNILPQRAVGLEAGLSIVGVFVFI